MQLQTEMCLSTVRNTHSIISAHLKDKHKEEHESDIEGSYVNTISCSTTEGCLIHEKPKF